MYERFFDLRERPFALSPDPDYLYRSRVHTEALSYLRYGIEGHAGFIVITGEIGSGKTTLLQTALRGVDKHTAVARVVNTQLDARDLLEAVMLDFGLLPEAGMSKPRLLRVLAEYLVQQRVEGRLALLVIDEAQNLSLSALEEVRMLSNLETEKSKLIQIALIGQPELRALLARPELEQLRQRVTVSYHLPALDVDETAAYINHRLARAAAGTPLVFSRDVSDVVHHASRGVPRRINVVSDAILLYGYGEGQRTIDLDLAQKAIDELRSSGILTEDTPVVTTPLPITATAKTASAQFVAPQPAAVVAAPSDDLVARQERLLTSLQHLITEQNHLLQLHREQLSTLIDKLQRPAPAVPAAPPASTGPAAPTPPGAPAVRVAPDPQAARGVAPGAPGAPVATAARAPIAPAARVAPVARAPMAPAAPVTTEDRPWASALWASSSKRMQTPPVATIEKNGLWSRIGRGFFNTFSPSFKD